MDVRCPKCGEPWDLDSIHEQVKELNADAYGGDPEPGRKPATFEKVAADFRRRGCAALGDKCSAYERDEPVDPATGMNVADVAATLYELLGDDMDGAASMLEDLGF